MHPDLMFTARVQEMAGAIIDGTVRITHVHATMEQTAPTDGPEAWELSIHTERNWQFTFYMEGVNISGIKEAIDTDGHRLIDRNRHLAALSGIDGARLAVLEETVLLSLAQTLPT